jgi:hypothetical protein
MTRAERAELLKRAVTKLDEAASILDLAQERLLHDQVAELADLIHVEIDDTEDAEAA